MPLHRRRASVLWMVASGVISFGFGSYVSVSFNMVLRCSYCPLTFAHEIAVSNHERWMHSCEVQQKVFVQPVPKRGPVGLTLATTDVSHAL